MIKIILYVKNKKSSFFPCRFVVFLSVSCLPIEEKLGMTFKTISASFIFGLVAIFLALPIHGQSLRNQSWVAMGTNAHVVQGLAVQQSIGQSSVVGVFATSSLRVSQGFLRGISALSTKIERPFEAIAFPNSFSDRITFRFTSDIQETTQVRIYDAMGKLVYETTHQPKNKEIQLNLPDLASGVYVAHLKSGNKFVQLRIIKKP